MMKFDGKDVIILSSTDPNYKKKMLLQLLAMQKDKNYRKGMIQCAVSFSIITQKEWGTLIKQIVDNKICSLEF